MRRDAQPPIWIAAGGGLLALIGAGLVVWRKRRSAAPPAASEARVAAGDGRGPDDRAVRAPHSEDRPSPQVGSESDGRPQGEGWECACGQAYTVSGRDLHRVFWLEGADKSDPVLDKVCPECGRTLR